MRRLLFLLFSSPLLLAAEVKLYLQNGSFSNGIVRTHEGGVIEDERIRIQAKNLIYERSSLCEEVTASDDLLILFDKRLLTGSHFSYDFQSKKGVVQNPVLASGGWTVSGRILTIEPDGSIIIEDGYVAPPSDLDMTVAFEKIRLQRSSHIQAKRLSIRLFKKELISWSQIRTSLDALTDIPVQIRFSFGGYENTRASLRYRLIKTDLFKAYLRLDAIPSRGLGGGLDTYYQSLDGKRTFDSKAFAIHDRSWDDPDTRLRYRFQGVMQDSIDHLHMRACYDWLSDAEMASNYAGKDFELPTAERTEFVADYKEANWLADFATRVRINAFQTINQELPSFQISWRPFALGPTGIMCDNRIRAAYLSYMFADGTPGGNAFSSGRVEVRNRLYRHFNLGYFLLTPEAGFNFIHYSNSPTMVAQEQAVATLGASASAPFFHNNTTYLHTVEPYANYCFSSQPTLPVSNTYIFSIDDGYALLNMLRLGVKQSFFLKKGPSCFVRKPLFLDLWAIGFFNEHTLDRHLPRIYGALSWNPLATVATKFEGAWNREINQVDYANFSAQWTVDENLALKVAFLNRGPRAWRKADPDNFMLDMIQTEPTLLNSLVSDRRNTLITNIFWRFHPNWTAQFRTHTGWNRPAEPSYNEYLLSLSTILWSHWRVVVNYERREIEDRFSFSFKLIN